MKTNVGIENGLKLKNLSVNKIKILRIGGYVYGGMAIYNRRQNTNVCRCIRMVFILSILFVIFAMCDYLTNMD